MTPVGTLSGPLARGSPDFSAESCSAVLQQLSHIGKDAEMPPALSGARGGERCCSGQEGPFEALTQPTETRREQLSGLHVASPLLRLRLPGLHRGG